MCTFFCELGDIFPKNTFKAALLKNFGGKKDEYEKGINTSKSDKLIHLQHRSLLCAIASWFSECFVLLMAIETQLIRKLMVFSAATHLSGEFLGQEWCTSPT